MTTRLSGNATLKHSFENHESRRTRFPITHSTPFLTRKSIPSLWIVNSLGGRNQREKPEFPDSGLSTGVHLQFLHF